MTQSNSIIRRHWPFALTGAMSLFLCGLLAQWTWLLVLPTTRPLALFPVQVERRSLVDEIVSRHMFGQLAGKTEQPLPEQAYSNLKLVGVFAAMGSMPAFAIIGVDGKPVQPVQAGHEVASGVVMTEVHPDYVVLRRNGVPERLSLESITSSVQGNIDTAAFKLNVRITGGNAYRFSLNELTQALQDTKQLAKLGRLNPYPTGGMIVIDAPVGSLVEKLGLRVGDVVKRFDNQPFNSNADVEKFVQQLRHVTMANLELVRNNRPLQLEYKIEQ